MLALRGVERMNGFNVNCRNCKYYQLRSQFDDNDHLVFIEECTALAASGVVVSVDTYYNIDCNYYEPR